MVQCRVPEAKRQAMAEFLTRAKYGLCMGNFEMDFGDGEVRYKASLDIADGELTAKMIEVLHMVSLSWIIHKSRRCGILPHYCEKRQDAASTNVVYE
jgi:hypothetical protein